MVLHLAQRLATFVIGSAASLFLSLGSNFSLASLLSALLIAVWFILLKRGPSKPVKYKVMVRALFPKWLRRPSFKADVWFLLLNAFVTGILIGWTVVSSQHISDRVGEVLTHTFGVLPKSALNDFASRAIVTVCLFL